MATFRFTAGPWNIHEGNETFGPGHRKSIPLEEKMKKYAEIGLAGMQFHDDDAVPDMNNMTEKQIIDYAKDVKAMLDKHGLFAEFVAPRLWFDKRTNDGGFTASRKEDREFAQWRARRSCDIASLMRKPYCVPESIRAEMDGNMRARREKQPLEYPSCGSTFKRPPGHFAGALIEQCGLKGYTVGGAQVSEKHAGFVINRGGATSADVLALIGHIQRVVREKTGVSLACEVRIIENE